MSLQKGQGTRDKGQGTRRKPLMSVSIEFIWPKKKKTVPAWINMSQEEFLAEYQTAPIEEWVDGDRYRAAIKRYRKRYHVSHKLAIEEIGDPTIVNIEAIEQIPLPEENTKPVFGFWGPI